MNNYYQPYCFDDRESNFVNKPLTNAYLLIEDAQETIAKTGTKQIKFTFKVLNCSNLDGKSEINKTFNDFFALTEKAYFRIAILAKACGFYEVKDDNKQHLIPFTLSDLICRKFKSDVIIRNEYAQIGNPEALDFNEEIKY